MNISNTLNTFRLAFLAIPLLLLSFAARDARALPLDGAEAAVPVYMISGLLRLKGSLTTVRLVQSKVVKPTVTDAIAAFTADIDKRFPEYDLIDTLVSPLTDKPGLLESPRQGQSVDLSWI